MSGSRKRRLLFIRDLCFWIGAGFAMASFCVVGASNTLFVGRLEHHTVPLSWALAGIAMVALFIAESCNSASTPPLEKPPQPKPRTLPRIKSPNTSHINFRLTDKR
jgi:hypothetical protein